MHVIKVCIADKCTAVGKDVAEGTSGSRFICYILFYFVEMYSQSFDYFYIVAGLSFGESVKGHAHELVDQQKDEASR